MKPVFICIALLLVFCASALAAGSLNLPVDVNFGAVDRNTSISKAFTIKNDGNESLTAINISSDAASKWNVLFAPSSIAVLAPNASQSVTVSAHVPTDESGNVNIGSVRISSAELSPVIFPIKAAVGGDLFIEDLNVFIIGTTDTNDNVTVQAVKDGETIKESIRPGGMVEFSVRVRNELVSDDKEDAEAEDVFVTITIEGIDDGEDVEEESTTYILGQGDSEWIDVALGTPTFVEEGLYDVIIVLEGDFEGDTITQEWAVKLEVKKKQHDIIIEKAEIFPASIKCSGAGTITVMLANRGGSYEGMVRVTAMNPALGINWEEKGIAIDEMEGPDDEKHAATVPFEIREGTAAGDYPITISAYYSDTIIDDTTVVELIVAACDGTVEPLEEEAAPAAEPPEEGTSEMTTPTEAAPAEEQGSSGITIPRPANIAATVEKSIWEEPVFLAMVIGANVLFLGIVIFAIAYFVLIKR
ncbi:TPA: hypothetical protein HA361_00435 [Candidatus Woesearchaeota archaeon]|nr:hypothetical protein [Candidatus Woesearchaeota archaeon]HII69212.1 hypothetical protein [Candidatus Woesearchaeota archaeon]